MPIQIETERLLLRQWKESDREPFHRMCRDPQVMEYFPALLSRSESDERIDRCKALIDEKGWGFWALEYKQTGEFIGFTGLNTPQDDLPFSPCVEIGWRLSPAFWGKGLAIEAAQAALTFGFEQLQLEEIVSFAVKDNLKSTAVMERLGMIREPNTFEHPALAEGHPLREHCLYRLTRIQWSSIK
ncbi:GNAT family N-acetyltransferase [Parendozoicomonas haliclonae]|uniref:Anhydro-N-acetylmuramic acid kinase n=1 Tax=Parendozoicomonas haliclonae TaxID=1960125 RepID=A0A1X7AL15_9GAMM|nr:GNAT family N-acetyltransferase [Parendozoicomonas haliclonae]SMA47606.1 anhydro-N-acetylmuramic acid kinase [Parendozoicomonas haliclonae]